MNDTISLFLSRTAVLVVHTNINYYQAPGLPVPPGSRQMTQFFASHACRSQYLLECHIPGIWFHTWYQLILIVTTLNNGRGWHVHMFSAHSSKSLRRLWDTENLRMFYIRGWALFDPWTKGVLHLFFFVRNLESENKTKPPVLVGVLSVHCYSMVYPFSDHPVTSQ